MDTEDRWYVRFRGHTLGPLTSEQVKSSVRRKELGPDDKLASASNPAWRALRTQEEFLRCWEALTRPVPAELAPLPSPKVIWQKKRAPLPAAAVPVAPSAAVPATQPTPVAATVSSLPEPKKAAKAKAKAKPAKKAKPARRPGKAKAKTAAEPVILSAPEAEALATIPEKPEIKSVVLSPEPAIAVAPMAAVQPVAPMAAVQLVAPSAAMPLAAAPKLAEETLSLLEALRDWNRREKENSQRTQAEPASVAAPAPTPMPVSEPTPSASFSRPEFSVAPSAAVPVAPSAAVPVAPSAAVPGEKRGIELRLNLVISKQFIFISGIVMAAALAAVIYTLSEAKKMRGPVSSRLPDPSSPTIEPSPKDDPIPQLKAPTRPKRD